MNFRTVWGGGIVLGMRQRYLSFVNTNPVDGDCAEVLG